MQRNKNTMIASTFVVVMLLTQSLDSSTAFSETQVCDGRCECKEFSAAEANENETVCISVVETQLPAQNQSNSLLSKFDKAMEMTRSKVIMRDTDILLASFPKSGTHFLASVVSELFKNSTGAYFAQKLAQKDRVPHQLFHGYPIFTLLPDSRAIPVPSHAFKFVEQVPKHIPRIFLTHERVEDLEFNLAPKTKVVYIMREPKAVFASLLRLYRGLSEGQRVIDANEAAKEFLELDNIKTGVYFPARLNDDRESPTAFVWHRHVSGWLKTGITMADRYRMFSFNEDVLHSTEAKTDLIRSLADFLLGSDAATAVDIEAAMHASSLAKVQERVARQQDDSVNHFHKGNSASWEHTFAELSPSVKHVFEKLASKSYNVLMRHRTIAKLGKKLTVSKSRRPPERKIWL